MVAVAGGAFRPDETRSGMLLRSTALFSRSSGGTFLLYLNSQTFEGEAGEKLAGEVRLATRPSAIRRVAAM